MNGSTQPLFRFDPGWLFVIAGLAICAAGILLPAQGDLQALQRQVTQLQSEEAHAYARLRAHSNFTDQVDRADPALIRRLAAAQLNLVRAGDTPILLAASETSPVTDWIDATVNRDIRPPKPAATSTLSQLANGPYRLWLFAGGIMSVFVGLMLSPSPAHVRPARRQMIDQPTALMTEEIDANDRTSLTDDTLPESSAIETIADADVEPIDHQSVIEPKMTNDLPDFGATDVEAEVVVADEDGAARYADGEGAEDTTIEDNEAIDEGKAALEPCTDDDLAQEPLFGDRIGADDDRSEQAT